MGSPASPPSADARHAPHATAPSWPGTPARRCASRRCAVARARPSTPPAPAAGRPPAPHAPAHARARSPRAPQTTGTAPRAALKMVQASSVACRPPPGTNVCRQLRIRLPGLPRPRWIALPRWPSRTDVDLHAEPLRAGPVTATRLARTAPNAASECSSQPPPSRCCDDRVNPPSVPRRRASISATPC